MPIVGEHSESEGIIVNVTPQIKAPAVHVDAPNVTVKPPSVTVSAPNVTIQAPPAPVVNVEASKIKGWTFSVSRNSEGLIETITAKPS